MDIRLDRVRIPVAHESMPGAMLMPARELPGVLFVHGWGGSQIQDLTRAREAAGLGCVCVTFDLRGQNLTEVKSWDLGPQDMAATALHPQFGEVTLRQLLSTWTVHDLGHLAQIARVMAKRYRDDIGPWAAFLPVVTDRPQPSG